MTPGLVASEDAIHLVECLRWAVANGSEEDYRRARAALLDYLAGIEAAVESTVRRDIALRHGVRNLTGGAPWPRR
jgi:hypothetical protein